MYMIYLAFIHEQIIRIIHLYMIIFHLLVNNLIIQHLYQIVKQIIIILGHYMNLLIGCSIIHPNIIQISHIFYILHCPLLIFL